MAHNIDEILTKVSDNVLEKEYRRRFWIKEGDIIMDSKKAARHFVTLFSQRQHKEFFVVLFLNGRNQHIATEILFEGTITTSAIYPREIIKRILELEAVAIVIAHNHPSGNLNYSKDDLEITSKIKEACETIDVCIHDHLIIAGESYTSFKDLGLFSSENTETEKEATH